MNFIPEQIIRIIGVPMDLGASRRGTDVGPSALRIAGLGAAIRDMGFKLAREEYCADSQKLASMEVVELNPFMDHGNISAERTIHLITSALGQSII